MKGSQILEQDGNRICVILSKAFYKREAVFGASYKFTDKCYIKIQPHGETEVLIIFESKSDNSEARLDKLALDFCNEALDQQHRLDLAKQFGRIRELIVEHAFSPLTNIEKKLSETGK